MLVIIGVAAAFCAAFLPHMTKPSVASKQTEANHPVACPLQWLPVLLAGHAQRFLVLTTQHSGSSWRVAQRAASALPGVICATTIVVVACHSTG